MSLGIKNVQVVKIDNGQDVNCGDTFTFCNNTTSEFTILHATKNTLTICPKREYDEEMKIIAESDKNKYLISAFKKLDEILFEELNKLTLDKEKQRKIKNLIKKLNKLMSVDEFDCDTNKRKKEKMAKVEFDFLVAYLDRNISKLTNAYGIVKIECHYKDLGLTLTANVDTKK